MTEILILATEIIFFTDGKIRILSSIYISMQPSSIYTGIQELFPSMTSEKAIENTPSVSAS